MKFDWSFSKKEIRVARFALNRLKGELENTPLDECGREDLETVTTLCQEIEIEYERRQPDAAKTAKGT